MARNAEEYREFLRRMRLEELARARRVDAERRRRAIIETQKQEAQRNFNRRVQWGWAEIARREQERQRQSRPNSPVTPMQLPRNSRVR